MTRVGIQKVGVASTTAVAQLTTQSTLVAADASRLTLKFFNPVANGILSLYHAGSNVPAVEVDAGDYYEALGQEAHLAWDGKVVTAGSVNVSTGV